MFSITFPEWLGSERSRVTIPVMKLLWHALGFASWVAHGFLDGCDNEFKFGDVELGSVDFVP